MNSFADFEVWIEAPAAGFGAGVYPVQVFSSPVGPAKGELVLDVNAADFQAALAQVSGIDPDASVRRAFGERLFRALFQGDILNLWQRSLGFMTANGAEVLRLRLAVVPAELAALPWETLYAGEFIATSARFVVARYLPVPEPPLLRSADKLKILVVVASPPGLPVIEEAEITALETQLKTLGGDVEYLLLRNRPLDEIHQALGQDFHVIHYLGHGASGKVLLVSDDGQGIRPVAADEFSNLFLGRRNLRLAVLNACHSATAEDGSIFDGVGPALIKKGLPAVISMQYKFVQLETAGRFSRAFYRALADGKPADLAVNEARQLLSVQSLGDRDWSTPVLHLGTRSGHILNPLKQETQQVEQAWGLVRQTAQQGGAASALAGLAQNFAALHQQHLDLDTWWTLADRLRELRVDFSPCVALVEQTNGQPNQLQFNQVRQRWNAVAQGSLNELTVFLNKQTALAVADWAQALARQSRSIESAIRNVSLKQLSDRIEDFDQWLAKTDAEVRESMSGALAALMEFSAQTIGRFDVN